MPDKADAAYNFLCKDNRSLFLVGGAGVGKSTVVRRWLEDNDNVLVTAPTGAAAINIGGQTLHSLFNVPIGESLYDLMGEYRTPMISGDKREIIKSASALLIDEISMVQAELLDMVSYTLQYVLGTGDLPFGGMRVILVGDPFQLAPVVKKGASNDKIWFFESDVWSVAPPPIGELTHIFRQSDPLFKEVLNRVRIGEQTIDDLHILNRRVKKRDDLAVVLSTVNETADRINLLKLSELKGKSQTYRMSTVGDFNPKSIKAPEELQLKKGARVLFVKNKYLDGRTLWVNGDTGTVEDLLETSVLVKMDKGPTVTVGADQWENKERVMDSETKKSAVKAVGWARQIPLRLGWAWTVHSAQGSTLEKVHYINDRIFSPGQTYTALSRVTSLEGLTLEKMMTGRDIKVDGRVKRFWSIFKNRGQ